MWKAYTREQAAKPKVTLIAVAAVFCGTVALAQWTVYHKANAHTDWPFRFKLPDNCYWTEIDTDRLRGAISSSNNYRAFQGSSDDLGDFTLLVGYSTDLSDETMFDRLDHGIQLFAGGAEPIQIGPLDGYVSLYRNSRSQTTELQATARSGSDFEIGIVLSGTARKRALLEVLRTLADSVKLNTPEKSPK